MIINGDCLQMMKEIDADTVDSIVTDPPYGLAFMDKKWDYDVPSVEIWKEALRVLKPGGHLLAFAGSRTYHRMAINIEDAGFEIRDQIMWVYGSGFPKSLNIGKAIDKAAGKKRETIPATEEAKKYEGWGTALKPAHEPIVMARKPFKGIVAENVLKWGTGGINIDGCRIGTEELSYTSTFKRMIKTMRGSGNSVDKTVQGRFPANFIHDGIETEWARFFYCAKASKQDRNEGLEEFEEKEDIEMTGRKKDSAGLLRVRKDGSIGENPYAGKSAKAFNHHPTVKPTKLMQYLCRLVTPRGGVVLDPFMGSGSTGKACKLEGFQFIGIELDKEYCKIAEARINNTPAQDSLL